MLLGTFDDICRDASACWTYTLEKDESGSIVERPIVMRQLQKTDVEFKLRNEQVI